MPFPKPKPHAKPEPAAQDAPLSKGAFFAEGRAMVDARREHLARMGMDPRHVSALRMPEPEAAKAPPVHADAIPEPNNATPQRKPLPRLAGVDFDVGDEQ